MFILNLDIIICLLILLIVNYVLSKKELLIDNPRFSSHKHQHKKIIPLSGGLFFIISYIILALINNLEVEIIFFILPFLIIGIMADTRKDFSPKIRLLLQLLFIILTIYFLKIKISSIDLLFFDNYLKNNLFNLFFTTFCLITVLNGHNFMDGLNGFVIGNLLLILISTYIIINNNSIKFDPEFIQLIEISITIYLIFFIFNIFGICFLGDNGIYIFSIFISLLVIKFIEQSNSQISPLIAVSFFWYPAYENLFSILRRLKEKKNISYPDKLHLHILIKDNIKSNFGKKINYTKQNSISGFLINFLLLPNFILSIVWYNSSTKLMYLIIFQIIIYMLIYKKLKKQKN